MLFIYLCDKLKTVRIVFPNVLSNEPASQRVLLCYTVDMRKRCRKCNRIKKAKYFHNDKSRKDGLYSYCISCRGVKTPIYKRKPYLPKVDKRYYKYMGMYYHRFLMEKKLGRKLRKKEIVHHRNGDKHDNRLSNLELIKDKKHRQMHYNKEKLKPKEFWCVCVICGVPFIAKQKFSKYHSSKCVYVSRKPYLKQYVKNIKRNS